MEGSLLQFRLFLWEITFYYWPFSLIYFLLFVRISCQTTKNFICWWESVEKACFWTGLIIYLTKASPFLNPTYYIIWMIAFFVLANFQYQLNKFRSVFYREYLIAEGYHFGLFVYLCSFLLAPFNKVKGFCPKCVPRLLNF